MKALPLYKRILFPGLILCTGIMPVLTSCGGSGSGDIAGIGGTGITQGQITAFGSIFVNGVEFETDNSQIEVDGLTVTGQAGQDKLAIGMVVTIKGDVSSDGLTGTADFVEFDDQIQGPVITVTPTGDGQKTLNIFNQSVVIDETSTSFQATSFADIVKDDILEISGFATSATSITATFVRKTGTFPADRQIELRGEISELTVLNFKLAGITINTNADTVRDVPEGILKDGQFVEVKGDLDASGTSVLAREIELEDEGFENDSEVSLQGVITQLSSQINFTVGSQPVDATNASFSPASAILETGANIEVEGKIVNGILVADEVELREGSVEIKAAIEDVDKINNRIEFRFNSVPVLVSVDNQTRFEDEVDELPNFSLIDIQPGNFLKIEGFESDDGIIASKVKRLNPAGEETEIQGPVSDYEKDVSVTILGVTFSLSSVSYEPASLPDLIDIGVIIELVDKDSDGIIDEVESE